MPTFRLGPSAAPVVWIGFVLFNASIDDVERLGVDEFLDELAGKLRTGRHGPWPLRRVHIPKPGKPGQFRPLGI